MKIIELKNILEQFEIVPKKSKGQNFLFDQNVINKIIQQVEKNKNILEVGPGIGALSDQLIDKSKKYLAVEVDKKIFEYLSGKGKGEGLKGEILNKDILDVTDEEIKNYLGRRYQVVANLPYSITSQFIRTFLTRKFKPEKMILMVQKEVAERMLAKSGQMNLLALSVQLYSEPKILFKVSKNCFYPRPKVDSAIIEFNNIRKPVQLNENLFFSLVKAGFANKRKKLLTNLSQKLCDKSQIEKVFSELGWDPNIRAQSLSLNDWQNLIKKLA